jgi:hypothetical protein
MRLRLKLHGREHGFEIRAQERHAVQLVTVESQPHPDQVQVVWHQAIRRAKQAFARGGVQQQFAEAKVKLLGQPARCAIVCGKGPMYKSVPLIILLRQAR